MTTISKTTYTYTVLHLTADVMSLHEAINEAEGGNAVGLEIAKVTVEVPDDRVPAELIDMGSDAEFFEDDLESPECAEGGGHINDDNPGRPICRTCDDDPNVSALYPKANQS